MRRMALLRNLEQSLTGLVEGTVGRVFRTEVRPTEIARKLAREMEINKRVSLSRTYAPTDYIVYLSLEDRARYAGVEQSIAEELGAYLLEHARRERLVLVRRPLVEFRTDQRLRLGEFGIEARTAPISAEEAPPRAEPTSTPDARPEAAVAVEPHVAEPAFEPHPVAAAPEPGFESLPEEDLYEDPYAGDPFGGGDVAQPEDLVRSSPEPPVPHADDWLDPVDDWEAPERAADAPHASPPSPAGAPWIDPSSAHAAPPAAPPVAPQLPPLVLVVDGTPHELHGDSAVMGRSRKCDIVISDPSVSRQHVELRRDEHGWFASDLGSTNGTLIDGQPLTVPRRLAAGARIEVGHAPAAIEVR
jgi:predicted component of type VI protein secretion system